MEIKKPLSVQETKIAQELDNTKAHQENSVLQDADYDLDVKILETPKNPKSLAYTDGNCSGGYTCGNCSGGKTCSSRC